MTKRVAQPLHRADDQPAAPVGHRPCQTCVLCMARIQLGESPGTLYQQSRRLVKGQLRRR